jgi:hypothetical protein
VAPNPADATRERVPDEPLRLHTLDALGPLGDALARAALESAALLVENDVLAWEGSHGTVHAHRIVLIVPEDLHARLVANDAARHAAMDALSAALAAAMAERAGQAMADVVVESGVVEHSMSGPYRDPRAGRT